ncbi:hypothetical protein DUNSADRAFT_8322 [Dunaliella salina]|uniref:KASH domain-containing protein n=1 Tax=Dunaliella salina TaxID=3046 RepID=A0ABQ7H5W8_DUNSA|nr:hypothetical protein DUNSADRAFT_8322 [Dunaliella salina]|eukprot:KAF5842259.1 hypothetical protein DUNSADRAFT_8322 [Dunaliella salina]
MHSLALFLHLLSSWLLLLLRLSTCQTESASTRSMQRSMAQARAPPPVVPLLSMPAYAVNSAIATHDVSEDMRGPLREAVDSTQVDAQNYPSVANTLAAALSPWSGKDLVAAPQVC